MKFKVYLIFAINIFILTINISAITRAPKIQTAIHESQCPPPISPKNIIQASREKWARINFTIPSKQKMNPCNVVGIYLTRVNIESTSFLKFVKKCTNIKAISLKQIQFLTPLDNRRVNLPALDDFLLYGCGVSSHNPPLSKEELKNLLFFEKGKEWKIEDVLRIKVNIEVNCGANTFFEVDRVNNKFVSNLEFTNEILDKAHDFRTEILDLRNCAINASLVPNSTLSLRLKEVVFNDGDLSDITNKSTNLTSLNAFMSQDDPNYFIYLIDIPKSLKSLDLTHTTLKYSRGYSFTMDNITLTNSTLEKIIMMDFPKIFTVKDLYIECRDTIQMHPLLFEILKIKKLEKISMTNFRRNETTVAHFVEMEAFLTKVGIPESRDWFVIYNTNGVWTIPPKSVFND